MMGKQDNIIKYWPELLLVLVAVVLRFFQLGEESLWADEFYTLTTVNATTAGETLLNVTIGQPHPPLYFLFMHFFVKACGSSDVALRFPSALAGAISPILLYGLLRALFDKNRRLALLGGFLFCLSPMHIWYSQEARAYSLMVMLELIVFLLVAVSFRLTQSEHANNAT